MKKTEFKVGKTFQLGLVKLRVDIAKKKCLGCYFINDKSCMQNGITQQLGFCDKIFREDRNDVIFVKVEE